MRHLQWASLLAALAVSGTAAAQPRGDIEALKQRAAADVDSRAKLAQVITDEVFSFGELGYQGERNDVAVYLGNLGWRSDSIQMSELLADFGLDAIAQTNDSVSVADTIYYSSVLSK